MILKTIKLYTGLVGEMSEQGRLVFRSVSHMKNEDIQMYSDMEDCLLDAERICPNSYMYAAFDMSLSVIVAYKYGETVN